MTLLEFIVKCLEEKRFALHHHVTRNKGSKYEKVTEYLNLSGEVEETLKTITVGYDLARALNYINVIDAIDAAEVIQEKREEIQNKVNSKITILEREKADALKPFDERLAQIERYCKGEKE